MQNHQIPINALLQDAKRHPLIDIRAAEAYRQGHFPGAVSLPFPEMAEAELLEKQMEIAYRQLNEYIRKLKSIASGPRFTIYCGDGLFKSTSCATFLNTKGFYPSILEGGYAAFRQFRDQFFQQEFKWIVLHGLTGSGKTALLYELEKRGRQCLHLEALAKHRGSAFGGFSNQKQPNNEQFANEIFQALTRMDIRQPIYVEYKGAFIGQVQIPAPILKKMKAPYRSYYLEVPKPKRIQNIMVAYQHLPTPTLLQAIQKLQPRLSKPHFEKCVQLAQNRNLAALVDLLLRYYDQGLEYQLPPKAAVVQPPFDF